ncbi:hypothetical protein TcCL_ESM09724 [Trypanosoma cruzi]|nr:hypothetical protein TcCL_ESM09724 [Trypanosoma cruzi]
MCSRASTIRREAADMHATGERVSVNFVLSMLTPNPSVSAVVHEFCRTGRHWEEEIIPRGGILVPAWPIRNNIPCRWNAVCQVNQRPRRERMCKLPKVAITPPAHTKSAGRNGQQIPMPRHPRLPRSMCTYEGCSHGGGALEDKCGT